jgi:uncharacterized protein YndB with AHSA1/START domain
MSDRNSEKGAVTMAKTEYDIKPGSHEISITRMFDAPRELVFRAFTDPALVPKWWGPRELITTVDKMDVRPGGTWRFVQRDSAGNQYGFHGVYHLVDAPYRVVSTFEFEGVPGHVAMETVTFEDVDGKTRLVQHSVFQSVADRDGMVQSGMEKGATESMDRMAELLAELSKSNKQAR